MPRSQATNPSRRGGAWPPCKRAIDVVGAALALVVLAPLLAAVAVAVKLDSRGPVLFRQARLGQDRQPFTVLKFRTMEAGASDAAHREYIRRLAAGEVEQADVNKLVDDPRVTRVGRLLRRTSLDELPQLYNVLRGDMSIVGPRPAIEYELEHYAPHHFERFGVRPGLTGLWQVSGRGRLGFFEMLDLDVEYVRTAGPATDLAIMARTPRALFGPTA